MEGAGMKKLLSVLVMLSAVVACHGQTVVYKTSATLQWDAVTKTVDGQNFQAGDVVTYEVYIYDYRIGVPNVQDPAGLVSCGSTSTTEKLITFPYRSTWAAGVRVKLVDGGGNISYSSISWSTVTGDAISPFVYSPLGLPGKPPRLKDSGT